LKRSIIKEKFNLRSIIIFAIFLLCTTDTLLATETDSLFKSETVIKMLLRADFSALQKDRTENAVYHQGELIYFGPDGESKKLDVKIIVRGNFRLKPENCNFPPISVHFNKNEVENTVFKNQDKLKLVTPCQNEIDVFDEYLIYKMYNQVTDKSLKVRLVKILFYDTSKRKELFEKYSFFIEDKKHFEERNNCTEIKVNVVPYYLERENVKRVSVFQYIIGNKDWYFHTRHNILLMQPKDTSIVPYAVPYDFDFSAFVDASYTKPPDVPDELLPNRRIYKGLCFTTDEFEEVFDFYRKLKPVFESIINNMELIPKSERKIRIKYIGYFYNVIENKEQFKKEFLDVCETKKTYGIVEK
jgi:hypothetical protein